MVVPHHDDFGGQQPGLFDDDAGRSVAAELRTQYSIGYYPSNTSRDGRYREIKVRATREGVIIRARPGYRAAGGA